MIGNTNIAQNSYLFTGEHRSDSEIGLSQAALSAYRRAQLRGRFGAIMARLTGRPNGLRSLEEITAGQAIKSRRHGGMRTVAIDQIRGTQGRSQDFDTRFNPLREHTRDRWVSVMKARQKGIGLPAVELVQVGEEYFVRDGHHRISVAQALGEAAIEAQVTVWER